MADQDSTIVFGMVGPSLGRVFQARLTTAAKTLARDLFDKYLAHEIAFIRRGGRG